MRTTLTLDRDVAARLEQLARRQKKPFRAVVNETLRAGLDAAATAGPTVKFRTTGFDLGPSLVGSLDDVEGVMAQVEGEIHR